MRVKTLEARRTPTKHLTHIWHWAEIEPRSQWLEVSALTTAPSLLSRLNTYLVGLWVPEWLLESMDLLLKDTKVIHKL